jgi:hypothetical protein
MIGFDHAGGDFRKRRFARSIRAEKRNDLAATKERSTFSSALVGPKLLDMERSDRAGLSAAPNAPIGIVASTRCLSLGDKKYSARVDNTPRLKPSVSDGSRGHPPAVDRGLNLFYARRAF